ncbi:TIR domain-containing protein [Kutzneria albida]|uniref:TIR domain-containing protein n=1 Tax=Kutzneria albida TaxID=43357 RepID=UPI0022875904|nr:TIR domain-containing protein [Kutzneria albida]
MPEFFVNYRTGDEEWAATLIARELIEHFGKQNVFFASKSIELGHDFANEIITKLPRCKVLVAVIGSGWLTTERGGRTIADPQDWVHRELAMAFASGLHVIPVLIGEVSRLKAENLPPELAQLAPLQYLRMRHREEDFAILRLLDKLHEFVPDCAARCERSPAPDAHPELDKAASQLADAVRLQWSREEERRRIHDPRSLDVGWHTAPEALMDHWPNIHRSRQQKPVDLGGRMDQILEVYRRVPSGRLVILGPAGSGKTILTIRFVLDQLDERQAHEPVPVIFSLGSWNPAVTQLRDWLTEQLIRDHPGFAAAGTAGARLAAALVDANRILPVLDGFDEIATGLHRAALDAINRVDMPLLLTSRLAEYTAAVGAADVLTHAAAIELDPLTLRDLDEYLPLTARRRVWQPVLNRLAVHPDLASQHVIQVLSNPLMVGLARTIYSDGPGPEPLELFDTKRFPTPESLETHLLDAFVPAAYQEKPRWNPENTQQWLGFLAQHLTKLGTPNLAWWQFGDSMPRLKRASLIGAAVGVIICLVGLTCGGTGVVLPAAAGCCLVSGLAVGIGYHLTALIGLWLAFGTAIGFAFGPSHNFSLPISIGGGLTLSLLYAAAYRLSGGTESTPSRARMNIRRRATRLAPMAKFLTIGSLLGAVDFTWLYVVSTIDHNATFNTSDLLAYSGFGAALGALIGMSTGPTRGRSIHFDRSLFFRFTALSGFGLIAIAAIGAQLLPNAPSIGAVITVAPPLALSLGLAGAIERSARPRTQRGLRANLASRASWIFPLAGATILTVSIIANKDSESTVPTLTSNDIPGTGVHLSILIVLGISFGLIAKAAVSMFSTLVTSDVEIESTHGSTGRTLLKADRNSALLKSASYLTVTALLMGALFPTLTGNRLDLLTGVLSGSILAVAALAGKAWGRWLVIARFWLPLTGRVPWRLVAFLNDAHQRGVLRQAGAVYQFRHAKLQKHLANKASRHESAVRDTRCLERHFPDKPG